MSKQIYKNLNTDIPLDVFAKLCADECRKLRVEKGKLLAEIDEKNDEIKKLKKQIKFNEDGEFMAIKGVKEQEMYQNLRRMNQRLRNENKHLFLENKKLNYELYIKNQNKEKEEI